MNRFLSMGWQWMALLLPLLLAVETGVARAESPSEAQVKGAYLYNFTKFVTWPSSAFAHEKDPFQLCIMGQNSLGPILGALAQKSVGTHPIAIRHPETLHAVTGCHLLFVTQSEQERIPALLAAIHNKPILTVSDLQEFAKEGGMIQFVRINDTLRFIIHQETALQAGLKIHATLLQVGHVVK
ncbi:MAG: YfiR family protein [Magnetococcales bacterium]|nr:YfiR family protein [Magnetococcales bacterium]